MSLLRRYLNLNLPRKQLIRERWRARSATVHPCPIFVFGNQKSGTTAVAALLAEATGATVTLDFAGAWGRHAQELVAGKTPIGEFVRRNAWAFSSRIVKEPHLTFAAPRLLEHFGQSPAIFLVRDPCANIRSILVRLKLPGDRASLAPKEWRRTTPDWRMILRGQDIGAPGDGYIETLAKRWLKAVEIHDDLKGRLRLLRYEDFNADKIGTIRALAQEFSLPVKCDITSSLDRAYQRRADPQWDPLAFFGRDNLDRIAQIAGRRAAGFGYQVL